MGEYDLGGKPVVYILFNLQHTPSIEYMKMEMTDYAVEFSWNFLQYSMLK